MAIVKCVHVHIWYMRCKGTDGVCYLHEVMVEVPGDWSLHATMDVMPWLSWPCTIIQLVSHRTCTHKSQERCRKRACLHVMEKRGGGGAWGRLAAHLHSPQNINGIGLKAIAGPQHERESMQENQARLGARSQLNLFPEHEQVCRLAAHTGPRASPRKGEEGGGGWIIHSPPLFSAAPAMQA